MECIFEIVFEKIVEFPFSVIAIVIVLFLIEVIVSILGAEQREDDEDD